jgi:hypothetical protein
VHFAHYPGAVEFDGARADVQVISNRFVGKTRHQTVKDITLALRQELSSNVVDEVNQAAA